MASRWNRNFVRLYCLRTRATKRFPWRKTSCFDVGQSDQRMEYSSSDSSRPRVLKCLVNQSHNPGKLTFVNASFWEKRTAIHEPRRPFNFDLKTYPSRTILREVSRVSSLILRAKPWLAKKVLCHGNRFVAWVRRRYFSEGEKRRPEMRLLFAG